MAAVGDILYLKGGSQPMTVTRAEEGNAAIVILEVDPGRDIAIPLAALTNIDPRPMMAANYAKAVHDSMVFVGMST